MISSSKLSNQIEPVNSGIDHSDLDRLAEVSNKIADAAGEVIRKYFRKSFEEDSSPVTIADRAAEESMTSIIQENFPSHAIKMASHIVGDLRMGPLEFFRDAKYSAEDLKKEAADLRSSIWKQMVDNEIKCIPNNTFSYYDQVLGTTAMLGAVPLRYIRKITNVSTARGNAFVVIDPTEWFDTNHHCIVPELGPNVTFSYKDEYQRLIATQTSSTSDLRSSFLKQMADAGIEYIPNNAFSYYDQVHGTTAMLGAVPPRYGWKSTNFSMARGNASVDFCWDLHGRPTAHHVIVSEDEYQCLIATQTPSTYTFAHSSTNTFPQQGSSSACLTTPSLWIIDSGAFNHITGLSTVFSGRQSPAEHSHVTFGDGSNVAIVGSGSVTISPTLSLDSVYRVARCPFSLMSVSQLTKSLNCSVTFYPQYCVFHDLQTGREIGGGIERNGVYFFANDEVSSSVAL